MTSVQLDPEKVEAGVQVLLETHPSWFRRLSLISQRKTEDAHYAAQTIVEAVLRAVTPDDDLKKRLAAVQALCDEADRAAWAATVEVGSQLDPIPAILTSSEVRAALGSGSDG